MFLRDLRWPIILSISVSAPHNNDIYNTLRAVGGSIYFTWCNSRIFEWINLICDVCQIQYAHGFTDLVRTFSSNCVMFLAVKLVWLRNTLTYQLHSGIYPLPSQYVQNAIDDAVT
jgi:hypothetical protein